MGPVACNFRPYLFAGEDMYNKLFTKILDSSIWLEPDSTRIVWITLLATMDEDGMCPFACAENVARRAAVPIESAKEALSRLESPDPNSSDPENEGRRIERVPGGWMVLNAKKHHDIVVRVEMRKATRDRVKRFRERNANVTHRNDSVTSSVSISSSESVSETLVRQTAPDAPTFEQFIDVYPRPEKKFSARKAWNVIPVQDRGAVLAGLADWIQCDQWQDKQYIPLPAKFLDEKLWNDMPAKFGGQRGEPSKNDQRTRKALETARRAMARGSDSQVDSLRPALPHRTG